MSQTLPIGLVIILAITGAAFQQDVEPEPLQQTVRNIEHSFAKTMADRDFGAFQTFLDDDAIFLGRSGPLRGKPAVAKAWQPFFAGPTAPFAWTPDRVEVLPTGDLALSTGPVFDPDGKRIGTFTSVWRKSESGEWKIVFDKGDDGRNSARKWGNPREPGSTSRPGVWQAGVWCEVLTPTTT